MNKEQRQNRYLRTHKKSDRKIRDRQKQYWSDHWQSYPHYPHQCWSKRYKKPHVTRIEKIGNYEFKILDPSPRYVYWIYKGDPSYPQLPKIKKKQFHITDFNLYRTCPKAWNKIMHIRPNRREWSRFCYHASNLNYFYYHLVAGVDGMPYPSDKKHIYYF